MGGDPSKLEQKFIQSIKTKIEFLMDALDGNVKFGMLGVLFYGKKKKKRPKQTAVSCMQSWFWV